MGTVKGLAATPGSIFAWGSNPYGQCTVPDPSQDFVAVSAGQYHSLGLKQDGSIVAFGDNEYNQGSPPSPNTGFVAISAGGNHNLAIKSDGSIVAWGGANDYDELTVPTPNLGYSAVSGGMSHSLGLKTDGSIVAWGSNSDGQCNVPSPNTGFVAISAGWYHSLGLKKDGSIVAWGDKTYKQIDVPNPNSGFAAISAGGNHSLGLKTDGSIVAWGSNSDGQCNVPSPNTGFVAISAGGKHSVALKSTGEIVAWGYNDDGRCDAPTPNIGYLAVAAGGAHTLAIVENIGFLKVTLEPQAARDAGGKWRVTTEQVDLWHNSGETIRCKVGAQTIACLDLGAGNPTAPLPKTVDINRTHTSANPLPVTMTYGGAGPVYYTLSVNAIGSGTVTPGEGNYTFPADTEVTITQKAEPGYHFVKWQGDVPAGQENSDSLNLQMNSDKTITAVFEKDQDPTVYTLTLVADPAGAGTLVKNPNQPSYLPNDKVTLTATAADGYTFRGWLDGSTTVTSPYTMPAQNKTLMAKFKVVVGPPTYTVTVVADPANGGTVSKAPNQATYANGVQVVLNAVAKTGFSFTGWYDGATKVSSNASYVYTVAGANKTFTAKFKQVCILYLTQKGEGTLTPEPYTDHAYSKMEWVTLEAVAAPGWFFDGWFGDPDDGDTTVTASTKQVWMTADKKGIRGTFKPIATEKKRLTVLISPLASGSVVLDPPGNLYNKDTVVTLIPSSMAGYKFSNWTGDVPTGQETSNPLNLQMNSDKTITAVFEKDQGPTVYTLTVAETGTGTGTVDPAVGTHSYIAGTEVTVTASPTADSDFIGWVGDVPSGQEKSNSLTLTMDGNKSLTAQFEKKNQTLFTLTTLSEPPEGGSIIRDPNAASYAYGTTVTLTAIPADGYVFWGWSGDASGSTTGTQVVMVADRTVTAQFIPIMYTLTVLKKGDGTVEQSPAPVDGKYIQGTTVTLTATPGTGYHFVGWTGSATGTRNSVALTMDSDKTVTANFAPNDHILTVLAEHGSVEVQPNRATYPHNSIVTLTALADDGYRFQGWSGATTGTLNPLVLVMDSDKNLTAHFVSAAPGNVQATDNETTYKVEVSWDTVPGATHYRVLRASSLESTPTALSGWIPVTSFIDDTVVSGVTYWYWAMAAKSVEGAESSGLSEPDSGFAAAETLVVDSYKVTYKGLDSVVSETTGGLKFKVTTPKSSLKIISLKGKQTGADGPGVLYLRDVTGIPEIEVSGNLNLFVSAAPVELLKVSGTVKSVTAKAGLRRLEAGQAGTVKVTALKDAAASPRTFSRMTLQTSDSLLPLIPLKIALKGVALERLLTQQTVSYLKGSTKAYRDKAKIRRMSLAGVGALWLVEPDALDEKSVARGIDVDGPDLLIAPEIKVLKVTGGAILSEAIFARLTSTVSASSGLYKSAMGSKLVQGNVRVSLIESPADLSILQSRAKKTVYGYKGGMIGYLDQPDRMKILVNNIKSKVSGDGLVSGVFYCGFDDSGKATYAGSIKQILSKTPLQGEAHVSLASKGKMKFKPTQGAFLVHTSSPGIP